MELEHHRSIKTTSRLLTLAFVLAGLYLCRSILVPLALASLFAFLLSPLVGMLCRRRLPRAVAVVLVTVVVFSTLTVMMWLLGREAHQLANELPRHRQTIKTRLDSLKTVGKDGVVGRLRSLAEELRVRPTEGSAARSDTPESGSHDVVTGGEAIDLPPTPGATAPPEAALEDGGPKGQAGWMTRALEFLLSTMAEGIATAGLVILFLIFILLRQEDISQRIFKLIGYNRLTLTAKAMDEIGRRVSRYLTAQLALNGTYGLLLGIGLSIIGVPYVVLWGVLAVFFRFIPYVGPWLIAILPISLSFAMFEGWNQPLAVIGLIVGLELTTNMILEPKVYGHSAGVSDFSLLLAIAFWTWIWGGIGLVLATPLTVCLVVICKHIPSLAWVQIVMGEKTEPRPHLLFYQRLLFDDEGGAISLIRSANEEAGFIRCLDEMALPALALARRERVLGRLEREEADSLLQAIHYCTLLLNDEGRPGTGESSGGPAGLIMAWAIHGEADTVALEMLAMAVPVDLNLRVSPRDLSTQELLRNISEQSPAVFCISAMPPGSGIQACVLCRRIRDRFPGLPIVVCRWGLPGPATGPSPLLAAGATWVTDSIRGAVEIVSGAVAPESKRERNRGVINNS